MKWFIALVLFCTSAFAEDSIVECVDRGRLAHDIASAINDGLKPESITFAFPNARNETELKLAEKWGQILISEVVAGLNITSNPEIIAQKVAEACAYKYGQEHSGIHKQKLASSERIVPNDKEDECKAVLTDQIYIFRMIGQKQDTFSHMRQRAKNSREGMGEEHYAKVLQLLEEAEKAYNEGTLQKWFDDYWHICYDGI